MRRAAAGALLLGARRGTAMRGCDDESAGEGDGPLIVSAASSLEPAFTAYAEAAGIEPSSRSPARTTSPPRSARGCTPDVYAAANTRCPTSSHAEDLVGEPVVFASNELVLAVPADTVSIDRVASRTSPARDRDRDRRRGRSRSATTRARCWPDSAGAERGDPRQRALAEPDVAGIVGKLTQGAVDAGFVYVTDVAPPTASWRRSSCRRDCGPRSPTAPRWSRARRTPTEHEAFIDGLLGRRRGRGLARGRVRPAARLRERRAMGRRRACSPFCSSAALARRARFPDPAGDRDLRRCRAGRAARQPRRARGARGALAQPADDARRAGDHRRRRHPGRLPARDPRVPRQGGGDDGDRAAAGAASRGRRDRAARRVRARGDLRRLARRRRDRARPADRRRDRRAHLRRRALLPAPGTGGVRRGRPQPARRGPDAGRGRGASLRPGRDPVRRAGDQRRDGARLGPGAGRVRGDADVRRLVSGDHRRRRRWRSSPSSRTDFTAALALSAVLVRSRRRCCSP